MTEYQENIMKVYTAPGCAYCQMVKRYLDMKGKNYEEINIDENQTLRDDLIKRTGAKSLPIIEVSERYAFGWNPKELEEILRPALSSISDPQDANQCEGCQ